MPRSTNAVSQKHNSEICFVGETTLGLRPDRRVVSVREKRQPRVGGVFWFDGENEDNSQENNGWGLATGFKLGF